MIGWSWGGVCSFVMFYDVVLMCLDWLYCGMLVCFYVGLEDEGDLCVDIECVM